MMRRKLELPSAKTLLSTAASAAAAAVLIRSVTKDLIPPEIHSFLRSKFVSLFSSMSSQITVIIDEFDGLHSNQLFCAAELYLGTKISPTANIFRAVVPAKETHIVLSMAKNQELFDLFDGVQFKWRKVNNQIQPKPGSYNEGHGRSTDTEISYFELSFHKNHRDTVMNLYLPHIVSQFLQIKEEKKTLNIHMLRNDHPRRPWASVRLDHPSTFETLAMEFDLKKMIMDDLDMFVRRKDFYRRVGKAWKRGYLLFGPPGTGKSSLIAAIANYLKFNVYDLELTNLYSDPRGLLIATENRSIIVVEDIDCSIDLANRKKQLADADPPIQPTKQASYPFNHFNKHLVLLFREWMSSS